MRYATVLAMLPAVLAADPVPDPKPKPTHAEEPMAKAYSPQKAAGYLDAVAVRWTRERRCVTCHTNMPYLMARGVMPGDAGLNEVRKLFETEAANWAKGVKPRGPAYVVATAAGLVFHDLPTGKLSQASEQALAKMWDVQLPTGEWNWLKCDWPPLEHDDYYGAVLAATVVGYAPQGYAQRPEAQPGLTKLKAYLAKTPPPDLHHATHLLWASTKLPGLLTPQQQQATIAELQKRQRPDGGWSLPSLGQYVRRDKSPNDPEKSPSDGYATGFVVTVLKQTGLPPHDATLRHAFSWLKANQRESGRWFTRSLTNDRDHYIANVGTAFALWALEGQ